MQLALFGPQPKPPPKPPPDRTCGQCAHLVPHHYSRTYYRCRLIERKELNCKASIPGDYRARRRLKDPACYRFSERPEQPCENPTTR